MPALSLCPAPGELALESLVVDAHGLTIHVRATRAAVPCPGCGELSDRVHSRYTRTLADLPLHGTAARLRVETRRFFCTTTVCPRRIFAERLEQTTQRYARRTLRLAASLRHVALALGGEAGARLSRHLGLGVSPDTLLRRIRAAAPPAAPTAPRVLGVDEWAYRKGQRYGTILVDLEKRRVVDLLAERDADSLAAWLQARPGVRVISRDRSGLYAEGASRGAPDAVQVADRWHLRKNLTDALQTVLDRRHTVLREAATRVSTAATPLLPEEAAGSQDSSAAESASSASRERRRAFYEKMIELRQQGLTHAAVAQRLGLSPKTVSRWLGAGGFPERRRRPRRPQRLDPYRAYLQERWQAGVTQGKELLQEIRALGYTGGATMMWDFLRELRPPKATGPAPPIPIHVPSVRRLAYLLTLPDDARAPEERSYLKALIALWPEIVSLEALSREFVRIFREQDGRGFESWLEAAAESPLRKFARGLRQDDQAVRAAITEPWSNGPTEGHVNRLKTLKRQMYGRASFDLLRARVLHAA